jgi:hypothetical protein
MFFMCSCLYRPLSICFAHSCKNVRAGGYEKTEFVPTFKQMKDYLHFKRDGRKVLCAVMAGGKMRVAKQIKAN